MPHPEAIAQEPVVQEPVGDEHGCYYDQEVEQLAKDEAVVVDVVLVVDVRTEKLEKKRIKLNKKIDKKAKKGRSTSTAICQVLMDSYKRLTLEDENKT